MAQRERPLLRLSDPTDVQVAWLKWAADALSEKLIDYQEYQAYYESDHELAFATRNWVDTFGEEFEEFADNWCQVVVDSMVQRLEVTGWETEGTKSDATKAEEIWDRNEMAVEEDDLFTQAAVKGDAYLIVWPDPDSTVSDTEAEMYFNDALSTTVFYDPSKRRRIARAAKHYVDLEGIPHMWIYTDDQVLHYVGTSGVRREDVELMQLRGELLEALPNGWALLKDFPNRFGEVPVFHLRNKSSGGTHGLSELKAVIPMQNAVNKLLMDMMVGSEFGSFRQKYIAGGGVPKNPDGTSGWKAGGSRVWHTTDPLAKFGEFGQIDLEPLFRAVDSVVGHIAKISQTPMHYLRTSGDMPSGEALKTAESGLVEKCKARQKQYGAALTKAMTFAVFMETGTKPKEQITPVWRDPEIRHDLEQAQTAQLKSILGIPLEVLWGEHFDYSQDQIKEFKEKNLAIAATVLADVIGQMGQLPPGVDNIDLDPQTLVTLLKQGPQEGDPETSMNLSQILATLGKGVTSQTTAGEATTKPQPNTTPPASPTRRSRGFRD